MSNSFIQCEKCQEENPAERYFCQKCGTFLHRDQFAGAEVYQPIEAKMMRITSNLSKVPHWDIDWNETVDRYTAQVERLQALCGLEELNISSLNSSLLEKMMDFLQACRYPEFQIAFVGTIKTGKSTLINALLGKNYASMDVTPETAALTKFRYSARDYVKVTFYTEKEWAQLWKSRSKDAKQFTEEFEKLQADKVKNKWVGHSVLQMQVENSQVCDELAKWSSSKYPEHYFVKEIEAGISSLPAEFPSAVVFVDTPGLSDPVTYRSDITREYIRRANAVFVCVDAQKIYKEEIETISSVFSFSSDNRNKVFIIATHWDQLNSPLKDWNEKQRPYLEGRLVGPAFFPDLETAKSNIMHASAFFYNLFRDFDSNDTEQTKQLCIFALKMDYAPSLAEALQKLDDLKKLTNVDVILKKITEVLVRNYETLLMGQLGETYRNILYELRRVGEEKAKQEKELITVSEESLATVKSKLADKEKAQVRIKEVQKQLVSVLDKAKQNTQKHLAGILAKLDNYANALADKQNDRR